MGEDAPYVWTGRPSQVRWCCRKSLICIRPGDRLAGRGLDGSTHAPLISLPAKLPGSRLGHQIQGASINPFHATPQSRTRFRWRPRSPLPQAGYQNAFLLCRTLQAIRASLFANATASLFLCNRCDAVLSHAPKLYREQIVRAHQQDLRRLDQQRAQILAAALGDAAEDRPPARAVLSRHEPEPGGKIAPALKSLSPGDRGHDTGGDYQPDPGHTHQPPALGLDLAKLFDCTGDGLDALVQPA